MIVIDEHFPESQRVLLQKWRVPFRQIGYETGRSGMKDDEIVPFLLQLRQPTFFTLDAGFFKRALCHSKYVLFYLDVEQYEAAAFVRRVLRHPAFATHATRLGIVARVSHTGFTLWQQHADKKVRVGW